MSTEDKQDEDFGDDQLPIGFRFMPTDEELVTHYLINKVSCNPVPASALQEIHAIELYSKPPKSSGRVQVQFPNGEREWFFFIQDDGEFDEQNKEIRIVGNGLGFWLSNGEKPLFDTRGNVLAFKIHFIYFSGCLSNRKKTHWRMDEYRLPRQFYTLHNLKEEWSVGRLRRGRDYDLGF